MQIDSALLRALVREHLIACDYEGWGMWNLATVIVCKSQGWNANNGRELREIRVRQIDDSNAATVCVAKHLL